MKYFYLLISAVCLLNLSAIAQWEWQNPLPQGNTITSVCFPDLSTGYASGFAGTLLKTTDGGVTWSLLNAGHPDKHFRSVFFTSPQTGFIAGGYWTGLPGDTGIILKTIDGGLTWSDVTPGYIRYLGSIFFPNPDTGYAIGYGGTILRSTNEGNTWTDISPPGYYSYSSVYFTDGLTGYVTGSGGTLMKTTNGGDSWNSLATGLSDWLSAIVFTNDSTGHAVGGYGARLKTIDGGNTWNPNYDTTGNNFNSLDFDGENNGIAVGFSNSGNIISRTADGGSTWITEPFTASQAVTFAGSGRWFAAGNAGTLTKSDDGGTTWTSFFEGSTVNLYDIYFPDTQTGYAAGVGGVVLKTTDAGNNWTEKNLVANDTMYSVFFINPSTGYVAGLSGKIYKTTDGGDSWTSLVSGTTAHLTNIDFPVADSGYIAGPGDEILATTDGTNWVPRMIIPGTFFQALDFPDSRNGYVGGGDFQWDTGAIARTTDGGLTWTQAGSGFSHYITDICMITQDYGFALSYQAIYRTYDGFASWTAQEFPGIFSDIFFLDSLTGYIIANDGLLYKTSDGGETWLPYYMGTSNVLFSVFFTDEDHGYISGSNGTILSTDQGSIISIPDPLPDNGLSIPMAVYPNPFSGQTTIRLEPAEPEQCRIIIYNHLSQPVRIIFSGKMSKGINLFTWDGSSDTGDPLPAGFYIAVAEMESHSEYKTIIKQ